MPSPTEMEMDVDPEYMPSMDDIQDEEQEEPLMMQNAEKWDRFLALVRSAGEPWPGGRRRTRGDIGQD